MDQEGDSAGILLAAADRDFFLGIDRMAGFYRSFLVTALGILGSAADSSLFDTNINIALPQLLCGTNNIAVRKEWFVFFDFPRTN